MAELAKAVLTQQEFEDDAFDELIDVKLTYDAYKEGLNNGIYHTNEYTNRDGDNVVELVCCILGKFKGEPWAFLDFVFNNTHTATDPYAESNIKYVQQRVIKCAVSDHLQIHKYSLAESQFLREKYAVIFDYGIRKSNQEEAVNG